MQEHVLAEFGRRLGLGPLTLSVDQPLTLKLGTGFLSLELTAEPAAEVLMILSGPLAPYDQATMRRALEACSFEHRRRFGLACGRQGDSLMLMTRLPADGCRSDDLEQAAEMLITVMNDLTGPGVK